MSAFETVKTMHMYPYQMRLQDFYYGSSHSRSLFYIIGIQVLKVLAAEDFCRINSNRKAFLNMTVRIGKPKIGFSAKICAEMG